jgi:hypothetical protein
MNMHDETKHKRRKLAWERMPTPRVSWETFKKIECSSSSLEQACTRAREVMQRQIRKQKNTQKT